MAGTAKIQHFAVEEGDLAGLPNLGCYRRQEGACENWGNGNAEKAAAALKKKENHAKLELLITSLC